MKALKEIVRIFSAVLGGIAALVFFRAPFTDSGLALTAGCIVAGLICFAGYRWSEPDEESPSDSN
jgi:hypothetical protein